MGSAPSPPPPPDPKTTAAAQTATNVDTAIANAALGHTNQVDAQGNSLQYDQTGTTTMTDQAGKTYQLPTYTAYQHYSPANQQIADTTQQTKQDLANIGLQQTQKVGDLLSTNADLSANNINNYVNDHWMGAFNRDWGNQQDALTQKLADQGITLNSPAYNQAMLNFQQQRQQSADQYMGSMYQNADAAILQQRNQPINEISALMSGSQIANPQYTNTPSTQLPTVDYAGIVNQNYQDQMAAYNAQLQSSDATMGGLFGLGSTVLGGLMRVGGPAAMFSDRRLKWGIKRLGTFRTGVPSYEFKYLGSDQKHIGAMADEVLEIMPEAVIVGPLGYLMVDYSKVL